jgi:dihydropteroate synthase
MPPMQIGPKLFDFRRTYIMGILNVTPDSFSDGGKFREVDAAVYHAKRMASEGADIIDVGGESTRPGSDPVALEEELDRVVPVIHEISEAVDIPVSIDTYKAPVAKAAIEAGASMINDISGLRFDPDMASVAARSGLPVVVMHIKGEPRSMNMNPSYGDVIEEIISYLAESIKIAEEAGVDSNSIVVDPGIGFGKASTHSFSAMKHMGRLSRLGKPILIGASRKSHLGSLVELAPPDRLIESVSAAVVAATNGAHFVRVHDVAETARALRVVEAINSAP